MNSGVQINSMSTRILLINILLKDKSDLVGVEEFIPNAYILGAMEKPNLSFQDIKVISTKFSKVGKTTLEKYPNLEWVVYRGHGTDSINLDLCKKHNVGVITTNPKAETESCAQWIYDKIEHTGYTVIFGNGVISQRLQMIMDTPYHVVDTKTPSKNIRNWLQDVNLVNVVSCVPLTKQTENMFNYDLFSSSTCCIFVSISRAKCHDNESLLRLINEYKIQEMHIDTLGTEHRDELLKTNKVHYYKHTSWDYLGLRNTHDELKSIIDSCLINEVVNPVVDRAKIFF